MTSIDERVHQVKQPRDGYVKASSFKEIAIPTTTKLHDEENIGASIVAMTVDYLTRYALTDNKGDSFRNCMEGARFAEEKGMSKAQDMAVGYLREIEGINDKSIIAACKLVSFDVWFRGTSIKKSEEYEAQVPDKNTIENIKIMVQRSLDFFKKYGPIVKVGFNFKAVDASHEGYTSLIDYGDGEFLTTEGIWDLQVTKAKLNDKQTLKLVMYWIMGQHCGQDIFKNIKTIGVFNAKLNIAYLLDVKQIPLDVFNEVSSQVIGYK